MTDQNIVICNLHLQKPTRQTKTISYRRLNKMIIHNFIYNFLNNNPQYNDTFNINTLDENLH